MDVVMEVMSFGNEPDIFPNVVLRIIKECVPFGMVVHE